MKSKIVHIVFDDKFIDGAISLYEIDDSVENTYIIIGKKQNLKYIKYTNIRYIEKEKALDYINQFNCVVIHSLPSIPLEILNNINNRIQVIWFAWGYDIYEKPYDLIPIKLYGPETQRVILYERFRRLIGISSCQRRIVIKRHIQSALSRIDYFSGVFPYEIDLLKKYHPEFHAKPLDFYYGAKDFFIPENPSTSFKHHKKNIIIGNSGDPSNNHMDVLKAIKSIRIDEKSKIIIPLSYCGTTRYLHKVENTAESLFPGQIVSLRNYLPLEEYLELISNCKTAVFAHERQQASDNVFIQLLYGARVYMSETSAAFYYLKSIGLKVYSLQSDMSLFDIEMSDEDVLNNRRVLSDLYSSTKLIERVKVINEKVLKSTTISLS